MQEAWRPITAAEITQFWAKGDHRIRPHWVDAAATRHLVYLSCDEESRGLVGGLASMLLDAGWKARLVLEDEDWLTNDAAMITQLKKEAIARCDWFLLLVTGGYESNLWRQLEFSIARAVKPWQRIIVAPTGDGSLVHGNALIETHQWLGHGADGDIRLFRPGTASVALNELLAV